jgi:hypothetical protein
VAFSRDGNKIVSSGQDRSNRIWDASPPELVAERSMVQPERAPAPREVKPESP